MYYHKSNILLATKHKKEMAVAAPFYAHLQANISVPENYDTDLLGTFTGEIKRVGTMLETALKKANDAIIQFNTSVAIASEGSFGPHPHCFFVPGNIEVMTFVDQKNNITVSETELTTDTNFSSIEIIKSDNYDKFLNVAKFGTHGLIIKHAEGDEVLAKGVVNVDHLRQLLKSAFSSYNVLRLETDMRAMMNPTRMRVIGKLANKLALRLKMTCPKCHAPGFGKQSFVGQLPCKACSLDTFLYSNREMGCVACDYTELLPREDGLTKADAKYCNDCNP